MGIEKDLLGKMSRLCILRECRHGVYLGPKDNPGEGVLLPGSEIPKNAKNGDMLDVFVYRDSEDRLIATTSKPAICLHEAGMLKVTDVTNIGAFLNWGLAKDLFLPFKEQTRRVHMGDEVLAALYIDKSMRLCATMHVYDYLEKNGAFQKGDRVRGYVYEIIDNFGAFVAVDNRYSALVPNNELTRQLSPGSQIEAKVKEVTDDGKLTLTFQENIKVQIGMDSERIYERLKASGGFLPFHDKTSPEIIKREFQMSKAAFKRATGRLMKKKKIEIRPDGIALANHGTLETAEPPH